MKNKTIKILLISLTSLILIGIFEDSYRINIKDKHDIALNNRINKFFGFGTYNSHQNEVFNTPSVTPTDDYLDDVSSDSIARIYYDSGMIKSITEYKDSIPHGGYTEYYESGQVKIESYYIKGKIDGEEHAYYPDGTKKYIKHYKEGREYGYQQLFNQDGEREKSYYVNEDGEIDPY
jgi:hypothetical protein